MIPFNARILVFLTCIWTSLAVQAKEVSFEVFSFLDTTHNVTLQTVDSSSDLFQKEQSHSPNLGNVDATLWIKIQVPVSDAPLIFTVENAHLDILSCYIKNANGDGFRSFHTGDKVPFANRDIPSNLFSFTLRPGEHTLYFQTKTEGLLSLPIRGHSLYEYLSYDHTNQMSTWLFYGIALIALSANLIFYLALKEKIYFYYSLYVLANIIYSSVDIETSFQYLWPNAPMLNKLNVLLYTSFAFVFLFCLHFLEIKKRSKTHYVCYQFFIVAMIATGVYSLIDYRIGVQILTYLILLMPFFLIISTTIVYISTKEKTYLLFLTGWGIYLMGVLAYILAIMGVLEYNGSYGMAIPLSSAFEMLIMFVTVMYKVNKIKADGMKAKGQVIILLQEQEKILQEQNSILEVKVKERTKELQELNDDIMFQNEEITTQNEELYQQRLSLEEQSLLLEEKSRIIHQTNQELSEYKEHLEKLVAQRTMELSKTNEELETKNKQMEQFSFMAAHNLRSPVASLLGLAQLATENQDSVELQQEIIHRIDICAKKLDMVVKTLNNMLTDLNTMEKLIVKVDILILLEEIKGLLHKEISDCNAQITMEHHNSPQVNAIFAYMHNLFYNLISNSLKYRRMDTNPVVTISTFQSDQGTTLTFQDNGIGIDLVRFGNEVFHPFKRFNDTVDGIGVGLYLVKTQMLALGGNIEVQSKVDAGTTFTVFIPHINV